ncbi:MAG: hypothetical protein I3273_06650 [Candidatus Moeniiplasma glomeromycotorum]|nr:hypothetical protein [Candidatus Moeniiplasma glomeromycotorum]MCE8163492.1 hypothetical protein [Candidatus Moeniiplasma glomeromycotorum]MCE8166476.1 hypothetical protein [Candidatus Moeniiplasma glomeromycotorum]MCE8166983.1 hypothetical protein [Candidatus Moeniiplasma glomeromycotorum]MCE8168231.1 hypothetical protein [Candidatus Moeniiplasma glomeromycotorum]
MTTQRKKRIRRQRLGFFLACFASLAGLLVYILGRHKIPFPHKWIPNINGNTPEITQARNTKLFFAGLGIHLNVNFFFGALLMFLNTEKMDRIKFRKWKFWISRSLIFIMSLFTGLMTYWDCVKPSENKGSWGSVLLLSLIITVINLCLLELLVQLMNQYGICNAFNLILFTEFLPLQWFKESWGENKVKLIGVLLLLFLISVFFIWLTNLKWEAPVETNTLYSQESKSLTKSRSTLGFKLSFSFMPFIYLSSAISFIYSLVLMKGDTDWTSFTDIRHSYNRNEVKKMTESKNLTGIGNSLRSFFNLNENKQIFRWKNIVSWISENKWMIIGAFFLLIFLRWLTVWLTMRKQQWNPKEVSKDLRQRGIYINQLSPGKVTRALLKKIVNKLVFFWYFLILVFNIIFDNVFGYLCNGGLKFFEWFGGVNIGVELFRQIRTKYKYIRN